MNFENTAVWGFKHALRGMRNPKNSWDRSDSYSCNFECRSDDGDGTGYELCPMHEKCSGHDGNSIIDECSRYIIGEADMKLAKSLIKAGSEHRKFLRQIMVSVDITAPLYWWKEFDTYKVGTTANSTSTMHKLTAQPITMSCFETDDYAGMSLYIEETHSVIDWEVKDIISFLEGLRLKYLETKDNRYWKELIRWLPESWLQTRTVTMNYENILSMVKQRKHHKLREWYGPTDFDDVSGKHCFIDWVYGLPYARDLLLGKGEV